MPTPWSRDLRGRDFLGESLCFEYSTPWPLPMEGVLGKEQVHRWDSVGGWGFAGHVFLHNWGEVEVLRTGSPRQEEDPELYSVPWISGSEEDQARLPGRGVGGHTPQQAHTSFPDWHHANSNSNSQKLIYWGFPLHQVPFRVLYITVTRILETRSRTQRSTTHPADARVRW